MGGGTATLIGRIPINHSRGEARRRGSRGKACLDEVVTILPAMVEPHFLADLSEEEIANVPDVGTRTVKRDWRSTRAWLHRRLAGTTA